MGQVVWIFFSLCWVWGSRGTANWPWVWEYWSSLAKPGKDLRKWFPQPLLFLLESELFACKRRNSLKLTQIKNDIVQIQRASRGVFHGKLWEGEGSRLSELHRTIYPLVPSFLLPSPHFIEWSSLLIHGASIFHIFALSRTHSCSTPQLLKWTEKFTMNFITIYVSFYSNSWEERIWLVSEKLTAWWLWIKCPSSYSHVHVCVCMYICVCGGVGGGVVCCIRHGTWPLAIQSTELLGGQMLIFTCLV
jgi:hypothetical protein